MYERVKVIQGKNNSMYIMIKGVNGISLFPTGSLPYKIKVVIAGNHDISFDDSMNELRLNGFGLQKSAIESYLSARGLRSVPEMLTNAIYLQDSSVTICGIKIYGSPW